MEEKNRNTIFQKIVRWNEDRELLTKPFNHSQEVSFIVEELLESAGNHDSISARGEAQEIANKIVEKPNNNKLEIVDAFGDIIVYSVGAIAKLGYDPDKVMDEIYKEIHSRTGKMINGKFTKDPEVKTHKADFSNCLKDEYSK